MKCLRTRRNDDQTIVSPEYGGYNMFSLFFSGMIHLDSSQCRQLHTTSDTNIHYTLLSRVGQSLSITPLFRAVVLSVSINKINQFIFCNSPNSTTINSDMVVVACLAIGMYSGGPINKQYDCL